MKRNLSPLLFTAVLALFSTGLYAGGSVNGKVTFGGELKAPKKIAITKDANVCGKVDHFDESLVAAKDKGLANVVVSIKNVKGGKSVDALGKEFVLDQNGCRFEPHVALVPVGATLKIKNSDGILHNIHTFAEVNKPINKAQPKFLKVLKVSFEKPEIVRVACDVHNWMGGYIAVVDNAYTTVTDASGSFELTDVPAGTYTVEFWHETLGTKTAEVTVKDGAAATANVEMK